MQAEDDEEQIAEPSRGGIAKWLRHQPFKLTFVGFNSHFRHHAAIGQRLKPLDSQSRNGGFNSPWRYQQTILTSSSAGRAVRR